MFTNIDYVLLNLQCCINVSKNLETSGNGNKAAYLNSSIVLCDTERDSNMLCTFFVMNVYVRVCVCTSAREHGYKYNERSLE